MVALGAPRCAEFEKYYLVLFRCLTGYLREYLLSCLSVLRVSL